MSDEILTLPYAPTPVPGAAFQVGDPVRKVGGDYSFEGDVTGVIVKRSGKIRYSVEDDRGILHIYSRKQLEPRR